MSRLRAFLAGHARDIVYWIAKLWWVFVIVLPLFFLATFLAIDHANANAARQQRRANQQFRQSQILANHKFQQAIRIGAAQSAYSINKSVCGFRSLVRKPRQRSQAVLDDPNAAPAAKAAARSTLSDLKAFLETQVTVPSGFKCSTLPKNPPRP